MPDLCLRQNNISKRFASSANHTCNHLNDLNGKSASRYNIGYCRNPLYCTSMSKKTVENTYPHDRHQTTSSSGASVEDVVPQESVYSRAASIIQRVWRAHVDTTVYKYLRKLVSFHNQGDPCLFLRYINPAEANILDSASGTLIRFRLGGATFPPNIYYKVFTRAPIVDMCACSPKDYTQQKKLLPRQIHNGPPMIHDDDHSRWYQRVENNGWRILSCKISTFEDPVTQDTNCKKTEFHYCRINRRQDVIRRNKIRKIEWMRKMYADGLLQVRSHDTETALLEESTQRTMNSLEQIEPDSVSEQEVEDLLAWTNALNFDEYIRDWMDLGTSNCCISNKDKLPFLSVVNTCETPQITRDDSQLVSQHQGNI